MNPRTMFTVMLFAMPIILILGIIFNMALYNECKKDGYSTFACYSMMHKGGYVIVDAADGNP